MVLWSHHFSIHQALFGHFRLCLVILMVYHPFFKHHGFQQDTAGKWLARAMQHRHQGRHETTWGIKNDWGRTICREPWFLHQIYGVPADFPFNEFGDIVHLLSLFRMFSDWFFTIKLNSSRGLSLYHGQSSQCQACWSTFGHLWDKFDSQIWTAKTISWELIPERWNPPFQGHENHTKSPLFFPCFSNGFSDPGAIGCPT